MLYILLLKSSAFPLPTLICAGHKLDNISGTATRRRRELKVGIGSKDAEVLRISPATLAAAAMLSRRRRTRPPLP